MMVVCEFDFLEALHSAGRHCIAVVLLGMEGV